MTTPKPEGPLGLLAELTYRCPLACAYCSNPIEIAAYRDELSTADWQRVITEAADLGALQCHLSGGEPLLRRDLADIVATARDQGLYTNLVTSALGFTEKRAAELHDAGLDHVQVSLQADEPTLSDRIAGTPSFDRKVAAARTVRELGWPLTLNVVLHRQNIDRVDRVLAAAEDLGADRIELANTQYYGWAWHNRTALLPSREQLAAAEVTVRAAKERLRGQMEIIYVVPDYYATYPKPCMGGWGARQLVVVPTGDAMPCLAAHELPLPKANVREASLRWILGGLADVLGVPRHRLDAGPLPQLLPARGRPRGLPLPGVRAHRRRHPHRPGLPPLTGPRPDRGGGRRGERRLVAGGPPAGGAAARVGRCAPRP